MEYAMKTFTFEFDTTGHKVYQVTAESAEEAANLLIEADEDGDDKYLIESEGDSWVLDAWVLGAWSHKSLNEKVQEQITCEWDEEE